MHDPPGERPEVAAETPWVFPAGWVRRPRSGGAQRRELGTIVQPTLLVAGKESPPAFAEGTNLMAEAMSSARVEWVDGGHLINPAHPAVLGFVDEVLARR